MSFEAVPCLFKSRDKTGRETPMYGVLIRPSGQQQSTPTSSSQSTTSTCVPNITTTISMASVGSMNQSSIRIMPSTSNSTATMPKILRPIGTGCIDQATLMAAVRAATPSSSILRPVNPVTLNSTTLKLANASEAINSINTSTLTTTAKKSATKKAMKLDKTPTVHNFCQDLSAINRERNETIASTSNNFESPCPPPQLQPVVDAYKQPAFRDHNTQPPAPSNVQSTMNESALEDLNSIEMNQLLANTTTINTEDYLDQSLSGNMDFYVGHPTATSTPNTSTQFQYPSNKFQQASTSMAPIESPMGSPMPSTSRLHQGPSGSHPQHYHNGHANHHMPKYHNYYGHPTPGPSHYNHQGSLLQPMHDHSHYHPGMRPSTSATAYGPYNHPHMAGVDPRRVAMINGMAPPGSNNQLSTSPDSGIQSIDGSPPSTFTPPMVSPYTVQATTYDQHPGSNASSANFPYHPHPNYYPPSNSIPTNPVTSVQAPSNDGDEDDFSDMPTLVRVDQMEPVDDGVERPESSATKPESLTTSVSRSNSRASNLNVSRSGDEEMPGMITITPGMDLNQFAEQLASTMDPEKLKQFTSIIQSKVGVNGSTKLSFDQSVIKELIPEPSTSTNISLPSFKTPSCKKPTKESRSNNDENLNVRAESSGSSRKVAEHPQSPDRKEQSRKVARDEKERSRRRDDEEASKNERLRIYRQKVEQKLKAKLAQLILQVGDEFQDMQLDLGPCHKFPLPWRSPDWSAVEKRCLETRKRRLLNIKPNTVEVKKPKIEEKPPKLQVEVVKKSDLNVEEVAAKKSRGRPRQKPPQLEAEVPLKRGPGRPAKYPKPVVDEKIEKSKAPLQTLQVPQEKSDKSKSPVVQQRRKRSKNSSDFVKIRSNVLIDSPPRLSDPPKCECSLSNPCITRNCSHRASMEECTQATCQWHEQCRNRRMGNNEAVHQLQICDTEKCGRGVKSATEITAGQFICEFVGEVVRDEKYQMRTMLRSEDMPRFGIHLTSTFVVDATQRGSIARFINHSCEPNCEMQRWIVNGYYRLGIFARKRIEEGEELTYDYGRFAKMEPPQKCECGAKECRGFLPYQEPVKEVMRADEPQQFTRQELSTVRKTRVLLPRNLKRFQRRGPNRSVPLCQKFQELSSFLLSIYEDTIQHAESKEKIARKRITQLCISMRRLMSMTHKSMDLLVERFDSLLKAWLSSLHSSHDRRVVEALRSHYVHVKRSRDIERHCPRLAKDIAHAFGDDRKRLSLPTTKREHHRVLAAEADLSYVDEGCRIGSYNPDNEVDARAKNDEVDSVRCVCGITEDDGRMVQCDGCNYWMHADCVSFDSNSGDEFECDFCRQKFKYTPAVDIVLKPQPEFNFPGCTYYRTLVNSRGLQVRVNESVYVERLINDDYKAILKSMHEECAQVPKKRGRKAKNVLEKDQSPNTHTSAEKVELGRQDVRHFRVERLFVSPQGQRFVFGCYYARPHETFCDSTRLFHKNEIFWTPMFDTLPLDAVIGRCLILEPVNWIDGRPRMPKYREEDVYVCEYQIDKNQRTFTKIQPNNHYYLNTASYAFEKFEQKGELKRNFTPFVLSSSQNPKAERCENREKAVNAAKELSARRLNLVWKQILTSNQLGIGNFR